MLKVEVIKKNGAQRGKTLGYRVLDEVCGIQGNPQYYWTTEGYPACTRCWQVLNRLDTGQHNGNKFWPLAESKAFMAEKYRERQAAESVGTSGSAASTRASAAGTLPAPGPSTVTGSTLSASAALALLAPPPVAPAGAPLYAPPSLASGSASYAPFTARSPSQISPSRKRTIPQQVGTSKRALNGRSSGASGKYAFLFNVVPAGYKLTSLYPTIRPEGSPKSRHR